MRYRQIPAWARYLLRILVGRTNYEYLLGDIEELYNQRFRNSGFIKANLHLIRDLLSEVSYEAIINRALLLSYLKTSIRNFSRNTGFSATALTILSIGFFSFFMISKFVQYESSFDNQIADRNVYRVAMEMEAEDGKKIYCNLPAPLGLEIAQKIPDVKSVSRICKFREAGMYALDEEQIFKEPQYLWADSKFLEIMGYKMISGEMNSSLDDPRAVVLTQSVARKYFGDQDPMGQTLIFKTLFYEDVPLTITGIIEDPPANSHMQFDILNSFATLKSDHYKSIIDSWDIYYYFNYVELISDGAASSVGDKIDNLMEDHLTAEEREDISFVLQQVSDIYLHPNDSGQELGPTSDARYSYFISVVGILILIMSGINYTNLATAKSMGRGKEIGIRKAIGANTRSIFWQHMTESQLLCLTAVILAVLATYLLIPVANNLFDRNISTVFSRDLNLIGLMLTVAITIGLLAGSYPAIILAILKPSKVLKSGVVVSKKSYLFRKILIVIQFSASTLILFSAIIVYKQMDYAINSDLGFDTEHLLIMPLSTAETVQKFELLKTNLEAEPEILKVAAASQYVGSPQMFGENFGIINPQTGENVSISSLRFESSHDFLEVLGAKFIAGRDFDKSFPSDLNNAAIVNEAFLDASGIGEAGEIVGETLKVGFGWGEERELNIVGVIKDFKMESMHIAVYPAVFYVRPEEFYITHIKIDGSDVPAALDKIESVTKAIAPEIPYDIFFQNESIRQLYTNDRHFQRVIFYFTILAILIACLGLFSFALYMIRQKTKEIGIRKVLGASESNIASRLIGGFVSMVLISFLISLPVAHLMTNDWLNDFSYRISPSVNTYAIVVALLLILTIVTVLFHSTKAAAKNPVDTLRAD